ncbi:MAG: saccharopine dehydrogenase NADP-binding domain-containing protein, partial [Paraburkholderia tropica]
MSKQSGSPERKRWIIYGANGYTGELIAREAARRGLKPVLAGRRRESVEDLARTMGLDARAFGLDDVAALAGQIQGHALVLNCAGPFSATAAPMMEACLRAGAHYLDITGEIAVFEHAQSLDARARDA